MKQFTLDLEAFQRPIIYLKDWHKVNALLDTGALFPVWTEDEALLLKYGGSCIKKRLPITDLGGQAYGNLYTVPYVKIGELTFVNMYMMACRLNQPGHILLPATMFRNLIYEIDDKNHKLTVTIPDDESTVRNLIIKEENGRVHVLCTSV